jgi:hypothetical protein
LLALASKNQYLASASTAELYAAVMRERKFTEYEKTAAVAKEHQVRTGVDTATKPMGGSAAGGGGAGSQSGQGLLTREQVQQELDRLAAGNQ